MEGEGQILLLTFNGKSIIMLKGNDNPRKEGNTNGKEEYRLE